MAINRMFNRQRRETLSVLGEQASASVRVGTEAEFLAAVTGALTGPRHKVSIEVVEDITLNQSITLPPRVWSRTGTPPSVIQINVFGAVQRSLILEHSDPAIVFEADGSGTSWAPLYLSMERISFLGSAGGTSIGNEFVQVTNTAPGGLSMKDCSVFCPGDIMNIADASTLSGCRFIRCTLSTAQTTGTVKFHAGNGAVLLDCTILPGLAVATPTLELKGKYCNITDCKFQLNSAPSVMSWGTIDLLSGYCNDTSISCAKTYGATIDCSGNSNNTVIGCTSGVTVTPGTNTQTAANS